MDNERDQGYLDQSYYETPNFINGVYYQEQVLYDNNIDYYDDGDEEAARKNAYTQ